MASPSDASDASIVAFFDRCNLPVSAKDDCDAFVAARYAGSIRPSPFQGYCSYTVFVGDETAVQFRPLNYKLDIEMARTASDVFKHLAPETEYLGQVEGAGLLAFSMRKLPGISLLDYRSLSSKRAPREHMVRDFAHLQALAWQKARRAEELLDEKRIVGSSLTTRLELMSASLPLRFRRIAASILDDLSEIEALPWVFTHGDFLPANIMVDSDSGRLSGLVDWAEAEWLPFGVGMYGLEELLGEDNVDGLFVCYPEARFLRRMFWAQLMSLIPELARDPRTLSLTMKAQKLGILLWHGIAFDDGNLNRVVEEGNENDAREIQRLAMFLPHGTSTEHRRLRTVSSSLKSPFTLIRNYLLQKV
ncbi:hypothetical protein F4808DRAFT_62458 [Astrocystis sublimbata]|nr:hypothetical protein F4808DRAFT_62458 [Astrocystis sublimbata]